MYEEQIPAEQADDESYRTCGDEERRVGAVAEEVRGQDAEGRDQEKEDEEEDDVRSDRDNTVDEAEDAHVHLEEAKCTHEGWIRSGGMWIVGEICNRGIERWRKGGAKSQPEGAECTKHDEWEGVSEDKFEERSENHE